MSAVAGLQSPRLRTLRPRAPALAASPRLALLGTGTVGAAWVERYTRLQGTGIELPALAWLAPRSRRRAATMVPQKESTAASQIGN